MQTHRCRAAAQHRLGLDPAGNGQIADPALGGITNRQDIAGLDLPAPVGRQWFAVEVGRKFRSSQGDKGGRAELNRRAEQGKFQNRGLFGISD